MRALALSICWGRSPRPASPNSAVRGSRWGASAAMPMPSSTSRTACVGRRASSSVTGVSGSAMAVPSPRGAGRPWPRSAGRCGSRGTPAPAGSSRHERRYFRRLAIVMPGRRLMSLTPSICSKHQSCQPHPSHSGTAIGSASRGEVGSSRWTNRRVDHGEPMGELEVVDVHGRQQPIRWVRDVLAGVPMGQIEVVPDDPLLPAHDAAPSSEPRGAPTCFEQALIVGQLEKIVRAPPGFHGAVQLGRFGEERVESDTSTPSTSSLALASSVLWCFTSAGR